MHHDFQTVDPHTTLQQLIDDGFLVFSQRAYPVVADDSLYGIISMEDVRPLQRDQWPVQRVADLMTPVDRLHTISPSMPASQALARLAEKGVNQLPVVEDGRLLGLVTREDILKWMVLGPGAAR